MPLSCESFPSRLLFLGGLLLLSLFYAPNATYAGDSTPFTSPLNVAPPQLAPVNPESRSPTGNNGGASPSTATTGDQGQMLLQQRLEQLYFEIEDSVGKELIYTAGYLLDLYRKNQFNPLWGNRDNINQLMGAIAAVADEGLIPDDYHLQALTRYANELKESTSPAKLVEYDLLLSDALVLLGQHKRQG
jgi:murein L,D-transpeptidase YcbB/YkuD